METVKTVKVKCQATQENPEGFYLVNETDVVEGMEVIEGSDEPEAKDLNDMTVDELKQMLDTAGVPHPSDARKADLLALAESANKDVNDMTVDELKQMLFVAGVDAPSDARKADLLALAQGLNKK